MQYIIKNFRRNTFTVVCNEAVVEWKGIDLSKSSYRFTVWRQDLIPAVRCLSLFNTYIMIIMPKNVRGVVTNNDSHK